MLKMSMDNLQNGRPRPSCVKRLFSDETKNDTDGNSTNGQLEYSKSIKNAFAEDTLDKSDHYNYDFVNGRPLPALNEKSGFDWNYCTTNCGFYFRQPYRKGDSLIPPSIDSFRRNSHDNESPTIDNGSNVKDLRTPAKRNPSITETVDAQNDVATASIDVGNESEK